MPETTPLSPRHIYNDCSVVILASSEAEALSYLRDGYGEDDHEDRVVFVGWMHEVGWDVENYASKEEFDQESGYESWWTGCWAPKDGRETESVRRAWEVRS